MIVTTASARNVRGVDYETFEERTPHGVAGATGTSTPTIPGPTYFNESVIPDSSETDDLRGRRNDLDLGPGRAPTGSAREHPDTRFASFLATCEPGRVVNANPPWGTYELKRKEKPLGASVRRRIASADARLIRQAAAGSRAVHGERRRTPRRQGLGPAQRRPLDVGRRS